jgi:drug/metabolite transporter (DMT)-like permease
MFLIALTSVCDTIRELSLKAAINSLCFNVDSVKKVFGLALNLTRVPVAWLAFAASVLSLFIWLFVLSKADLNFAFSMDSMHYIFIAFASGALLKEKVGRMRWLGTLSIVIGITLVASSR